MEKVEVKFVVDIVGHDEATIMQMYKDWLASPLNNNVQPEPAMPKIAEIIETMKKKIESSLEEFHKENPDSLKRIEYHNIIKEAELLTCDELLKEFYSNFTQLNKGE